MRKSNNYHWGHLVFAASFVLTMNWYQSHFDIVGSVSNNLQPNVQKDLSTGDFQLKPSGGDDRDSALSRIEIELQKQRSIASAIKFEPRKRNLPAKSLEEENAGDDLKIKLIKSE